MQLALLRVNVGMACRAQVVKVQVLQPGPVHGVRCSRAADCDDCGRAKPGNDVVKATAGLHAEANPEPEPIAAFVMAASMRDTAAL